MRHLNALTLTELVIVAVIVSCIAALSLPNYSRAMERTYEKDIIQQLRTIYAAEQFYRSQTGNYWPAQDAPAVTSLDTINNTLQLSILSKTFNLSCTNPSSPTTEIPKGCRAARTGGQYTVILRNDIPLSNASPYNPYCSSTKPCPTLP